MQVDDGDAESVSSVSQNIVPVDCEKLRDLGVNEERRKLFSVSQNTAHINLIEFFQALPFYPIAFVKQPNNDFTPCVLLSLAAGENLFVDKQGNWQVGTYIPAYFRRYPFTTEKVSSDDLTESENDLRKPIFVDDTALSKEAPSLFIANGVATAEWQAIESFVSEYISAEKSSLLFTEKLVTLKLLEPFDAQVHPKDREMVRLKGLFRVNEDKLNALPADTIKDLMQSGELSRIYAHLISLENFAKLLDREAMN